MSGWIKLHRSLLEWEWWDDHNATRLLICLLCAVNHEDKKWRGISIPSGSMVLSWQTLSDKCNMTVQECRTAMKKLEGSGEVTRKTTNRYQVLSLVKWEKLQDPNKQLTSNLTDNQQATNKQLTTTKELKNNKNDKKKEINVKSIDFDKFLLWFNRQKKTHIGKLGKHKVLSKTDKSNLKELRKKYDYTEFDQAVKMMFSSDWAKRTGNQTPSHFLRIDNFNRYLSQSEQTMNQEIEYKQTPFGETYYLDESGNKVFVDQ